MAGKPDFSSVKARAVAKELPVPAAPPSVLHSSPVAARKKGQNDPRIVARVTPEFLKAFKRLALEQDKTVEDMILAALREKYPDLPDS